MFIPRSRIVDLWDQWKGSYWFVPSIMFVGAVVLAGVTLRIDLYLERSEQLSASAWFPKFAADGARSILSTLASGMLTVTGLVFSLTIVALQLASTQFGPRLLRTFMNSRGTQVVLGTFTSSFVYCMLIVGTVRGDLGFVPQVSTATGIVLGVIDIAVLIFFVHHLANSIRIETLLGIISDDLRRVIDGLYPSDIGEGRHPPPAGLTWNRVTRGAPARTVCATGAGYIRHIDSAMLLSTARDNDLILHVLLQPGAFVVEGAALLGIWPDGEAAEAAENRLRASFVLGRDRTPLQDVVFALRQLVEVALRALSPGINDPFTAVECTNRLAEALCLVARRRTPSAQRFDDDGQLRVIAAPITLPEMARTAFDPIARAGGANGDVAVRILEAIVAVATCARQADDRRFLLDLARDLQKQMLGQLTLERDRLAVSQRFYAALKGAYRHRSRDVPTAKEASPLALEGDTA